jgi:uncharacterized membrane protein YeaQ/YmgE (transglycosylase-associated protein family)
MSSLYVGAIYYAMEVSHSEVDAGGTHEALIGVGYAGGPLCGLLATGIAASTSDANAIEPLLLGIVGAVALATAGIVFKKVHHHTST